jgi:hypothetical protein
LNLRSFGGQPQVLNKKPRIFGAFYSLKMTIINPRRAEHPKGFPPDVSV